jgi:nucleoside-diphosphate-sugar epimerase
MNILLLGGTGLLGPYVVRQLVEMGHDVTIFHTGGHEAILPAQVRHVHDSSARIPISGIPPELAATAPDVVVHMGPEGEHDAQLVVDAFKGRAGRLVAISSQDVYRAYNRLRKIEPGPPDPLPITEESPLREKLYPYREETPRGDDDPQKYYDDYDKILVERAVMDEPQLPGTILRLPMIYGPGDRQHRLHGYLKRMDDGRPAILLDEGHASWRAPRGFVENVAWAVSLAATGDKAKGRVYNVAEPECRSEADWVRAIARVAGWRGRVVTVPEGRMLMPYDTRHHWVVDSSRIRRDLGYDEPISAGEALRRAVEWERANPPSGADAAHFDYTGEDAILGELAAT